MLVPAAPLGIPGVGAAFAAVIPTTSAASVNLANAPTTTGLVDTLPTLVPSSAGYMVTASAIQDIF